MFATNQATGQAFFFCPLICWHLSLHIPRFVVVVSFPECLLFTYLRGVLGKKQFQHQKIWEL